MGKRIICYILIVAFIIAGIFAAKYMSQNKKATKVVANTITNTEKSAGNNNNNNKINNSLTAENKIEEKATTVVKEEKADEDLSPEERAIKIVKNNWGEDNSVYYSYDGIDDTGRYIICVRDKNTTKALYFYYVDLETGAFEID